MLAYMMRMERMSLLDAFVMAKQRRLIIFPNVGFWHQLMEEELALFGSNSKVPSDYKLALEIHSGARELSPKLLLERYITVATVNDAEYFEERKGEVADEWPDGWPASEYIHDLFLASLDLQDNARTLAVEYISLLLARNRFTRAEVLEAFALLESMNLDDLRIDVPKVDAYVAEMLEQAEVHRILDETHHASRKAGQSTDGASLRLNVSIDLTRYIEAQNGKGPGVTYDEALKEIQEGEKKECWIWYIFPQFLGPRGGSSTSQKYQLHSRAEAIAFLTDPILGPRFVNITTAVAACLKTKDVTAAFGWDVDAKKFHQSATVLRLASEEADLIDVSRLLDECLDHIEEHPYEQQVQRYDPDMKNKWDELSQ